MMVIFVFTEFKTMLWIWRQHWFSYFSK